MRGKIDMRPEEHNLRLSQPRCTCAPPAQCLCPICAAVCPVDKQQTHLVWRRELGRIIHALRLDAGPSGRRKDARCHDEVPAEEDDSHSPGAGSEASGVMGPLATTGRGVGEWTPLPFDPLKLAPSIRYRAMRIG
jgi:hypothetical protein